MCLFSRKRNRPTFVFQEDGESREMMNQRVEKKGCGEEWGDREERKKEREDRGRKRGRKNKKKEERERA